MRWNTVFGALVVSVGLCGQSYGFGLLDRMLSLNHCGSCATSCCETSCCEPEPTCCEPEPVCCEPEPTCCEPDLCCGSRHGGLLSKLFSCNKGGCCETSCCEPEPVCCEPEPSCCEPDPCCGSRHGGLLAKLFSCRKSSCCTSSCGGCSTCGGGVSSAPAEAHGDETAPLPPAPMPDPSASVQRKRWVIQTAAKVSRK